LKKKRGQRRETFENLTRGPGDEASGRRRPWGSGGEVAGGYEGRR